MAGGAKNKQKDEDAAGPSWASVKSGSELRDPKTMFQPDPHPMKVQMARQASNKGARPASSPAASPLRRSPVPQSPTDVKGARRTPNSTTPAGRTQGLITRLEETETLLAAQRDVNRGLDNDVHKLMAQLEDLNRRYAALGRRTAGLQDELATAASGDFQALRQRLKRAEGANADLEQVAKEKVEAMRAERDAFAERLRHVEAVTLQQDTSAVEELQADLESARAAEIEAKRRLAEEAESAARQAAAQAEVSAQLERVQTSKAALEAQLAGATSELAAAQAEARAAREEATGLAQQLEAAEKSKATLEADLQSHIERHAGGIADMDAMFRQLQAAQSSTAALGAEAAELRAEIKAVNREKRAAEAAKGALEVDLKAVLARHAREVEAAASARREAAREKAARAAAETEIQRLSNQVRSLEAEKSELANDVTMQQESQNAKSAEMERLRREVASAHAERHTAVQQLARVEGQKASLESELQAANEELAELPARLDEAMAAADAARADAQTSAEKAAALERRVGELEEELGNLAAAAQAAEDQSVQLMQQVQVARAAEADAARESAALAEQVRALEQQAEELSGLLGRQSGDVAAQSAHGAAGPHRRRSMDSANGRSLASSVSGSEAFVPSAAGSEDDEAAAAAEADAGPTAAPADLKEGAPGAEEAANVMAAAAATVAAAASNASHPLAETAPAAEPPAAQSPATPPAKSAPVDVPQLEAVRRESREFRSSSRGSLDSPSRDSPSRHTFDAAGSARLAAAEEEVEILRKQVDHLRAQVEESKAAAPPADVTDLTADLTAARKRITELEDQLRTSASPAAAAGTATAPAAAGKKLNRRGTGGWEDLLEIPADQRGNPPTAEQLALLQEQMQKLVEEREAAERELKSLASQLGSRTGADAADAGDMHSLRSYWRENERLQKAKAAVEDKIRRMAVIPGIGMPRAMPASGSIGELSPVVDAVAARVDAMAALLKSAEAEAKRLAAERDALRRQLDEALAAAAASATQPPRSPAASPMITPSGSPATAGALEAASNTPPASPIPMRAMSGGLSPRQLQRLRQEKSSAEATIAELRAENEQLRRAVAAAAEEGAAANDAAMKMALAQEQADRLRSDNAALLAKVAAMQQQHAEQQETSAAAAAARPATDDSAAKAAAAAAAAAAASEAAAASLRAENAELVASANRLKAQLAEAAAAARSQADSTADSRAVEEELCVRIAELETTNAALQSPAAGGASEADRDAGSEAAGVAALQQEVEHLRFANEGLEAQLAKLAAAGGGSGSGGDGDVELELLRHELEDLRHDNAEMENGFHEAAAQIERECAERVQQLESQLAAARAEVEEAQRDAAAFAQDLADHLSRQGPSGGAGSSGPSAADRAALKQAHAEAAAARKEVEWLTQQLAAAQGFDSAPGGDGAVSDQEEAMTDPLSGPAGAAGPNGAAAGGDRHNGGAAPGGWMNDSRWSGLRKRGEAAGWLVDPSQVQLGSVLGEGSFGTTYRGTWRGADCAVKVVRISKPDEANSFLREVEALSLLRHPNIMPFFGATLRPPAQCWLVCEYMPGGTLSQWLYGANADPRAAPGMWQPKHSLGARVEMALGVARGMAAMEAARPPLLHRDLKPTNIFIDAGGAARVADMGLARHLTPGCGADLTGETGTYYYMAPEVIRHEIYDSKADVFSWGVLFAELLTARPPYGDAYLTPVQVAIAVGDDKLRPTLPKGLHPGLAGLARATMDGEPSMRPSFASVVEQLTPLAAEVRQQEAAHAAAGGGGLLGRMLNR